MLKFADAERSTLWTDQLGEFKKRNVDTGLDLFNPIASGPAAIRNRRTPSPGPAPAFPTAATAASAGNKNDDDNDDDDNNDEDDDYNGVNSKYDVALLFDATGGSPVASAVWQTLREAELRTWVDVSPEQLAAVGSAVQASGAAASAALDVDEAAEHILQSRKVPWRSCVCI